MSPELNPVERVWLFLKEKFLSRRLLDDYDAILDAAAVAWNRMAKEKGRLATLSGAFRSRGIAHFHAHPTIRSAGDQELELGPPGFFLYPP